jgi:hypothetical protein
MVEGRLHLARVALRRHAPGMTFYD